MLTAAARAALALATTVVAVALVWGVPAADRGPVPALERSSIAAPAPPVQVSTAAVTDLAAATTTTSTTPTSTTTTTTAPPPTTTTTTAAPAPPPTTTTTTTTTTAPSAAASSVRRDHECESSMLRWMDDTRAEHGIAPLQHDQRIQHVPVDWSTTMADRGELAHNPHYGDQIFAVRPEAGTAAENVGRSHVSARAVYDEFLRSDGHRDKILGTGFTHTAVGCVRDAGDQLWVTVNFWG